MIEIGNVLVSDEVVEARFVCDLDKCKGGCCEDGDAGAPLEKAELKEVDAVWETVKEYMTPEGIAEVERQGRYVYDREFGWVTPTINGAICAYGYRDERGIIKCAMEQAFNDGKTAYKKPVSCHLYPIKITQSKAYTMVNYEPRETLCKPACSLGKKLKVPVYQFLRASLERRFGTEFYDALRAVAAEYYEGDSKK